MKQGQLFGQPFVVILALILGALIISWGLKAVFDLQKDAEKIDHLKKVDEFKNLVEDYYSFEPGSQKVITLRFNKQIEQLCFQNPGDELTLEDKNLKFLMEGSNKNLFFVPESETFKPTDIPNLKVSPDTNPLCINNLEKVLLITRTDHVEIQPYGK